MKGLNVFLYKMTAMEDQCLDIPSTQILPFGYCEFLVDLFDIILFNLYHLLANNKLDP